MELEQVNKGHNSGHSIVYSCRYHVVWCPKYRRKVLDEPIAERLKALILEQQDEYQYKILDMEVMPDHVHIVIDVDPRVGVVKVVGKIKGYTSHCLRNEFPALKSRLPTLWTRSKFISSVGAVTLEVVKKYIEQQKDV